MPPITPQTSGPTPRDHQLLEAWLDPAIQSKHAISQADLLFWAAQSHIAALLEQVERLISRRTNTLLAQSRSQAIAALLRVLTTSDQPEIIRRAADRLVRQRDYAAPADRATHPPSRQSPPPTPSPPPTINAEPLAITTTQPPPTPASRLIAAAGRAALRPVPTG